MQNSGWNMQKNFTERMLERRRYIRIPGHIRPTVMVGSSVILRLCIVANVGTVCVSVGWRLSASRS